MDKPISKTDANDTYGSFGECQHPTGAQRPATEATARARLFNPPAGWPVVGNILGATRWAAVDTETSGLDPSTGCRCIEVAAVIVEDGRVTIEWSSRINPGPLTTWEEGAIACNGVSPGDLATAPSPTDVWRMFLSLTAGLPPIDSRILRVMLRGTSNAEEMEKWRQKLNVSSR